MDKKLLKIVDKLDLWSDGLFDFAEILGEEDLLPDEKIFEYVRQPEKLDKFTEKDGDEIIKALSNNYYCFEFLLGTDIIPDKEIAKYLQEHIGAMVFDGKVELKRLLCDAVGVGYHTSKENILSEIAKLL